MTTYGTVSGRGVPSNDKNSQTETTKLQKLLKLYFYTAVKYSNNTCSFHCIYFVCMVLQVLKLSLITAQMFNFGYERESFNNVVERGHLTLQHLLLKDWSASWETPAYPPARGDFAAYDINDLKEKINYAVEQLYNAEEIAKGFYKHPDLDLVTAELIYFDFGGFQTGSTFHGLSVRSKTFVIHVASHRNQTTNETSYTYDVDTDFERNNLTEPIKRMLKFNIMFQILSVRVFTDKNKALCLNINGTIKFSDPDNNGQVNIDLETNTVRQICKDVGYDIPDVTIEAATKVLTIFVLVFAFMSLLYTIGRMTFGVFVFVKTRRYMKENYRKFFESEETSTNSDSSQSAPENEPITEKKDLPFKEYLKFIKLWDILVLLSDITIIAGNIGLELQMKEEWTVASLEQSTVLFGIGCLLAWIGLLRYFKFNYKFHLLFNTLYASFWDVLAYLACICVLFVGCLSFGYVVLGPYHVKFETPSSTAETLFSILNGDEIYTTFALLNTDQTGGDLIPIIFKIYLGLFIGIFTIIVLNLLIALFTNAYDAVKKQYEEPNNHHKGTVETAQIQIPMLKDDKDKQFIESVLQVLKTDDRTELSGAGKKFKKQLKRIVSLCKSKPKTIKTFINEEDGDKRKCGCGCFIHCL